MKAKDKRIEFIEKTIAEDRKAIKGDYKAIIMRKCCAAALSHCSPAIGLLRSGIVESAMAQGCTEEEAQTIAIDALDESIMQNPDFLKTL